MENNPLSDFTERLLANLGGQVESILFYPHPFSEGGVIIVFCDGAQSTLELVSKVYLSNPPPPLALYCLRREELFTLSLPGLFQLPDLVSEHLYLAYWLKHKGTVLYGSDLRDQISLPPNPKALLDLHIEACLHSVRTYHILQHLVNKEYSALIERLLQMTRSLMSTALLTRGHWDVQLETIPTQFDEVFADSQAQKIWADLLDLEKVAAEDKRAARQSAFEAAWLFECFIRRIGEYVR